ncbi:hypothetical protein [Teredinibacter purpureus]|uniref:hypothetical protein n=1 Tax=Teredinibacter purpureus TaxID=2731756 RepID=UPI000697FB05|nr:hypothetical protein [Teredinibacter purpureus]
MISTFLKGLKLCCTKLALALCGLGICCPCLADFWDDDKDNVHSENQRTQIEILSVHMMDDEALFASAQVRRDSSMNREMRILNSQWLVQSEFNTWSGNKAVTKILKTGFTHFLTRRAQMQSNLMEQPLTGDITNVWQDYTLELSGERIRLGMTFKF